MAIRALLGVQTGAASVVTRTPIGIIRKPNAIRLPAIALPTYLETKCSTVLRSSDLCPFEGYNALGGRIGSRFESFRDRSSTSRSPVRLIVRADTMSSSAAETQKLKIIGISGSLRSGSTNTGLLRAAADIVEKEFPDVSFEILDISALPFINTDLEVNGTYPQSVTDFRSKVLHADGILFASPEFNYSITGALKNAVDWASRPPNVWADKGAAIVSSGGGAGGARSAYHLRQSGVYIDLHFINKPELFVRAFEPPQKFDQNGNLVDEKTKGYLKETVKALRAWIIRLKH